MPLRTESHEVVFAGNITMCMDKPLKKYIVVFDEYADIIEASNMKVDDQGVVFEESIIKGKDGIRIGIGTTFIEHARIIGVTLVSEMFGGVVINNDTQLGLFSVINDED